PALPIALLLALRPKQWMKNLLLFAALLFSERLTDPNAVALSAAAFAIFVALSGTGYLVNDVMDVERDRGHPRKSGRPVAAGWVTPGAAVALAVALSIMAMAGAIAVNAEFAVVSAGYLVLTLGYSMWLKHVFLVDVILLSGLYVVRAAAGAYAIQVIISPWLLLCTILLALFLGLAKRRQELITLGDGAQAHRAALAHYSVPLLDQLISLVSSAVLIAYALYTFFSEHGRKNTVLVLTFPLVVYGLFRYLYLAYQRGGGESPEDVILRDPPLLACIVLWGLAVAVILYWPGS
ncbi:MAG: decaprenyl-phosphate phosphoribosyltransferase, partial [Actinomycetota bacterium]|nr:decaprenyl-phosphate phosphoribosyltransferase [Actinomycetota bacterium]